MALTFESRQGLSKASLTISRQATVSRDPQQEISKRLRVYKRLRVLKCWVGFYDICTDLKSGGVSAFFALDFKRSRRCRLPANR